MSGNAPCTVAGYPHRNGAVGSAGGRQSLKSLMRTWVYALGRLCPLSPKNHLEGMEICRTLGRNGLASTLGKFSKFGDDPAEIAAEYRAVSDTLAAEGIGAGFYLSIKPPALRFDPDLAVDITTTALHNGHPVHFDSHEFDDTAPTLDLLRETMVRATDCPVPREGWTFGLTLPSRWKRSISDTRWAAANGIRARLVKGEFRAPGADEMDPRRGFLALIDELAGAGPEIVVATHDHPLAREAIIRCKRVGAPVQLELLFGMPVGNLLGLARDMDVPVAFYVPYGETLLVYAIRHLLTNPHKLFRGNCLHSLTGMHNKLARIVSGV